MDNKRTKSGYLMAGLRISARRIVAPGLGILLSVLLVCANLMAKTGNKQPVDPTAGYKAMTELKITEILVRPLSLEDCIGIALSKNILLRVAQNDLLKAEAALSGTYGDFYPLLSFEASKGRQVKTRPFDEDDPEDPTRLTFDENEFLGILRQTLPTGAVLNFSGDLRRDIDSPDEFGEAPTRTRNRFYRVAIEQPILRGAWPTVVRSQISTAQYDRDMREMELIDQRLETIFQVKRAFFDVLRQKELMKVHESAIERDSTLLQASASKVLAKIATRRDVLSAEIQLEEDRAALIRSQTAYELAVDNLKDVMGVPIDNEVELQATELTFTPPVLDSEALMQSAFKTNPLIQRGELAIDRGKLQITVARNALLPSLDINASYTGRFDSNTDRQTDLRTTGWEASLTLSYPFFNRQASANAQRTKVALAQQHDQLEVAQRVIRLNIRSIVRTVQSMVGELSTIDRTIEAADQKVRFATTMFNLGRASNLDVTDAQERLLRAQTRYIQKLVDYHVQMALLERLTGQQTKG